MDRSKALIRGRSSSYLEKTVFIYSSYIRDLYEESFFYVQRTHIGVISLLLYKFSTHDRVETRIYLQSIPEGTNQKINL